VIWDKWLYFPSEGRHAEEFFFCNTRIAILKTIDTKLSIHCGVHVDYEYCVVSVGKNHKWSIAACSSILNFDVKIMITGGIGFRVVSCERGVCWD
jgi:hypothetical protein